MGTLWQFFGFPDPEAPSPDSAKRSKKKKPKKSDEAPGQQLTIVSPDDEVPTPTTETPLDEKVVEKKIQIPKPIRHTNKVSKFPSDHSKPSNPRASSTLLFWDGCQNISLPANIKR